MLLAVLKHGGSWDFMARMFCIKGPTFERLIVRFLTAIYNKVYERYVLNLGDKYTMDACLERKKTFRSFPMARYATDVTFQQANRPSGNMQEGKKYYSAKHKLYGYKTEVSVLPFGLAINSSLHYPGNVPDIDIFYKNIAYHEYALSKSEHGKKMPDIGPLCDEYPNDWAVLLDKGYQGAREFVRAIHPKKKPRNDVLTIEDENRNRKLAGDRIIVENFFERQCSLWSVCANKFRWGKGLYDAVFKLCVAMTNAHIKWHPLRAEDLEFYRKFKNRQYDIGEEVATKRKRVQQRYRLKRKKRMAIAFNETPNSDDDTVSP